MGMSIERLLFLQQNGHLASQRCRVLDIGPQNVYHIEKDKLRAFVERQGCIVPDEALAKEIDRLVYFSTPRPEERTTLLSEITDLTDIEYNSFDVCPGLKTDIIDLNFDALPERYREYYDVVLNFGTSEHVFNQWNCFGIMHDALKPGGIMYCHLQVTGSLEHGYYFYTPQFFRDMAGANDYEIETFFLAEAGFYKVGDLAMDIRSEDTGETPSSNSAKRDPSTVFLPAYNIHAVLRKTRSAPFRCVLEVATAHASVDPDVLQSYNSSGRRGQAGVIQGYSASEELEAMRRSMSWRITSPLRSLRRLLRPLL